MADYFALAGCIIAIVSFFGGIGYFFYNVYKYRYQK